MKRLNPNTGKEFQRGDLREDGWAFFGYRETNKNNKTGFFCERWSEPVRFTLDRAFRNARTRAKEKSLPFNLDLNYLVSIHTKRCPVFNTELTWGCVGQNKNINSPSLDRIIPSLGYVKGNVVFLSDKANRIKAEFEEKDLYAVADWLHEKRKEVLSAIKESTTPIPNGTDREGKDDPQHGAVPTAGTREDHYDLDHHCGADVWEDSYRRTKEGC